MAGSLFGAARACLDADTIDDKLALTFEHAHAFAAGTLPIPADAPVPEPIRMPGRPPRPALVHPRELPRRGLGTTAGRAAFIHAIVHIEFNAIDLAWDAAYRFRGLPAEFYADWVRIAADEARHSPCCAGACRRWATTTATSTPTTACGKWPRRPRTTGWRGWHWCRACWKRAGWT